MLSCRAVTTVSSDSAFFFFNDTATTEIYTLSLHDALPIFARAQARRPRDPARDRLQGAARAGGAPRRRPLVRRGEVVDVRQDRKSTRLNSSHSQISYAVFCLKKKTKSHSSYSIVPFLPATT